MAVAENIAVPGGWKLVPVEPTREMVSAGYQALSKLYEQGATTGAVIMETGAQSYRAMLDAAPYPANFVSQPPLTLVEAEGK